MNTTTLIALYSLAVVASSLLGGWLPSAIRLTHVRMQLMLSFVGGVMLGVGLLHMLPHSYVELESLDGALHWMLVGLLGMFLLIRTFHFHEHGAATSDSMSTGECGDTAEARCEHDRGPSHASHGGPAVGHGAAGHTHEHVRAERPLSSLSWVGVACGLSLHAFLDGIALSAGIISDASHRPEARWAGLSVFLAILLHKPLDALSITALMRARDWSYRSQQIVNAGFAMMCPLGAWVFAAWVGNAGSVGHQLVGIALAISAGVFLCISLSDLLPEVQFHRHDRLKLSAALILGVLSAYAIHYLEPAHAHSPAEHAHEHAHGDPHDPLHDHAHDDGHEAAAGERAAPRPGGESGDGH